MFVVSTLFHGIVTRNEFELAASWRYVYDMRKSNFPDFQRIFLYFPDFSQNLKFPWPSTKFPDLEFAWPVATMTFGSSNLPRLWYILSCLWDGTYKYVCPLWGIDLITTIPVLGVTLLFSEHTAGCCIQWLLGVAVLLYTMHLVVGHGTNHELSQTPFWLSLVQIYGFVALMTCTLKLNYVFETYSYLVHRIWPFLQSPWGHLLGECQGQVLGHKPRWFVHISRRCNSSQTECCLSLSRSESMPAGQHTLQNSENKTTQY